MSQKVTGGQKSKENVTYFAIKEVTRKMSHGKISKKRVNNFAMTKCQRKK